MACPSCSCKVAYPYFEDDFCSDVGLERCAHCGFIFDVLDSEDEDDDYDFEY